MEKRMQLTVTHLQVIAMVTMLIDHLANPYFNNMVLMRCIGRFAFPIYAFLVVEGYRHIKNNRTKMEAHLGGYLVLAVVTEFCYDLAECGTLTVASAMESQNCIITLLLGFLGLIAIDQWKDTNKTYMWAAIALTAMANFLILSNYKFAGVLLMYAFYYYLNRYEGKSYLQRFLSLLLIFACYIPVYHWARYNFCSPDLFIQNLQNGNSWWYATHILIAALLAAYTGKKGLSSKGFKLFYRNFYPGHLLLLGLFRHLILKI